MVIDSSFSHEGFSGRLRRLTERYAEHIDELRISFLPSSLSSIRHVIPAQHLLFCTRVRLVRMANVFGLKSVKHGMDRITSGVRYAVSIPFHEFY
jgi:hypothetical protein